MELIVNNLKSRIPGLMAIGYKLRPTMLVILMLTLLAACGTPTPSLATPTPSPPPLAKELIFYDWVEDMPQSVLAAFTEKYGVKVTYRVYETQEEALANIKAGEVYDVVVLDNNLVPIAVADELLAEINYDNVPNFEHIAPNFKDLVYDPNNMHSIPFNWGTTGLIVRSDLVATPITRWADLWELNAGKIAIRDQPRDILGLSLKSLGYSINSTNPDELEAALQHLLEIKPEITFVDVHAEAAVPLLTSGEVVALVGWSEDVLYGQAENEAIIYVLPEEGLILWGDNFVIPANSPRKYTAELFLNFLLEPKISAQIVNQNRYASPNEAAYALIEPEILNNPTIFPTNGQLKNAETILPLDLEANKLYNEIWERFKTTGQ